MSPASMESDDSVQDSSRRAQPSSKAALKLARKRARDRRAQQAMRNRAKEEVESLKAQVAELSFQLETRSPPGSTTSRSHVNFDEVIQLQQENEHLRQELTQRRSSSATQLIPHVKSNGESKCRINYDPSILEAWYLHLPRPPTSARTPGSDIASTPVENPSSTRCFVLTESLGIPQHIPPTCPADRIMQPLVEEKRRLLWASGLPIPQTGSPASYSAIQSSISTVAADLLGTYVEIETLPKRMACLYVICSALNVSS